MYTKAVLDHKKRLRIDPGTIYLAALILFVFCPVTLISTMSGMVGDTAIQIRLGLDGMDSGKLIVDEIYSWHEGLTFTAHESGWYVLLGFMYRILGIWGPIFVGTLFNYATGFTALWYFRDTAHPIIATLAVAITPFLGGFPDYNVRPSVVSAFAFTLLMVMFLKEKKPLTIAVTIVVTAFALSWLHGGILPLYFSLTAVLLLVQLIFRKWKDALFMAGAIALGFLASLLNPIGINTWLFGLRQMTATDIWAQVDEWKPKSFTMFEAFVILLFLIGVLLGKKIALFEKGAVTKLLLICMFLILTCVYKRFALYFSITFLLFAPEAFETLLLWINGALFHIKKEPVISSVSYYILTAVCAVMIAVTSVIFVPRYLPTGKMADIEKMAAYDEGVIDFVKEKGYSRMFNSFNTGSWLIFHGVPVHIDNRIDPYMREFSDEDHIRDKMYLNNITELEVFCAQYKPDAILLDIGGTYSLLLDQIALYAPDKYKIVYDNTVGSTSDEDLVMRWVVIECVY